MTTTVFAPAPVPAVTAADAIEAVSEPIFRRYDTERAEGVAAFRGLMFASLLSLPIWGLLAGAFVVVRQAFFG